MIQNLLHGAALADILGQCHDAHHVGAKAARVLECDRRRAIAATVVDDDDFVRVLGIALLLGGQKGQRLVHHDWQALLLIVRGHDERYAQRGGRDAATARRVARQTARRAIDVTLQQRRKCNVNARARIKVRRPCAERRAALAQVPDHWRKQPAREEELVVDVMMETIDNNQLRGSA